MPPDESTSTTSTSTTETSAGSDGASESTSTENGSSGGSDATSERQSLIDAANEAADPAAETKADKKSGATAVADALGTEPDAAGDDDAPEVLSIDDILKGREKKQAVRNKIDQDRADAQRARDEAAQDRAEAKREREETQRELARVKKLVESPSAAFKELGWDDQKVVDSVLTENSPEGREIARQRAENAELKAKVAKFDAYLEQQEKSQKEAQEVARSKAAEDEGRATMKKFMDLVPPDSALRALYGDDDIAVLANTLGWKIKNANGGRLVASFEQIRDHLEKQASERLARLRGGTEQKSEPTKVAPQKSGPGSRTLSTSGASERRASPRPIRDMSAAEEREALIAAARDAVQTDK